jgi:hypothetical protein
MALGDITREAMLKAIEEYDVLGQPAFGGLVTARQLLWSDARSRLAAGWHHGGSTLKECQP